MPKLLSQKRLKKIKSEPLSPRSDHQESFFAKKISKDLIEATSYFVADADNKEEKNLLESQLVPQTLFEPRVNRWIRMMNVSQGNVNSVFIKILAEIERNVIEEVEMFQKNVFMILEQKIHESQKQQTSYHDPPTHHQCTTGKEVSSQSNLVADFQSPYHALALKEQEEICTSNFHQITGFTLPISNLDEFETFNNQLENNKIKQNALKKILHLAIDFKREIASNTNIILKKIATPLVLYHYSGKGNPHQKRVKKNFSITNVYKVIEEVLVERYKRSADDLKVLFIVSRNLSQIVWKCNKMGENTIIYN